MFFFQPEGITHFFNKPYFVDLGASGLKTQFTLPFPASGIVDGSERIEVTAMGMGLYMYILLSKC